MANADTPFGMKPIFPSQGSGSGGHVQKFYLPDDYATNVFIGDPVIKVVGGTNGVVVNVIGGGTYGIGTLPEVNLATVTDASEMNGVVVGFEATTRDSTIYGAASTVRVALVQTDPYQEYLMQTDGAIAAVDYGRNFNGVTTHSGSTVTGISGIEIDGSDASQDASAPFYVLRAHNSPDNDGILIHAKVIVRINLPVEAATRAGILAID